MITGAITLFRNLRTQFPQHNLLATGFDKLSFSDAHDLKPELANALNAPLVSNETGFDLSSYLLCPDSELGTTDVFFSSNFDLLQNMYHHILLHDSAHHNNEGERPTNPSESSEALAPTVDAMRFVDFVRLFVDYEKGAPIMKPKFNPMFEDFNNVQCLVGRASSL